MAQGKSSLEEPSNSSILAEIGIGIIFIAVLLLSILLFKHYYYSLQPEEEGDSICEFITFGLVRPKNSKESSYWKRTENELKRRCRLENDVFIYQIGIDSSINRSLNLAVPQMQNSYITMRTNRTQTQAKPTLLIQGRELSKNLLSIVQLELGDRSWTILWRKTLSSFKLWQITAQNLNSLKSYSVEWLDFIEQSTLKLLSMMMIGECNQSTIQKESIKCSRIDYMSELREDVVMPLLESFIANTTECVKTEFCFDGLKLQIGGKFEQTTFKSHGPLQPNSSNEVIGFQINLCH